MTMRVVVFCEFRADAYSGGRVHAWLMAEALATFCDSVDIVSREEPIFKNEYSAYPSHQKIRILRHDSLRYTENGPVDVVICVPSLSVDWTVYRRALSVAKRCSARLIFIDFEAPNWFNKFAAAKRRFFQVHSWLLTARRSDVVLSTTAYGSQFAQAYYGLKAAGPKFLHCAPSINSLAADQTAGLPRKQIICVARMTKTARHKGVDQIKRFLNERLANYDLLIVGRAEAPIIQELKSIAEPYGINIVNRQGLSEREKYQAIRESELMLFLSDFEGYGYPPLEAAYCGVPSLLRPLPVYREIQGDAPFYWHDKENPRAVLELALDPSARAERVGSLSRIAEFASFAGYVERLRRIMIDVVADPPRQARGGPGLFLIGIVARVGNAARRVRSFGRRFI